MAKLIKDADILFDKDKHFATGGVILETREGITTAEFWGMDAMGEYEFEIDGKPISYPAESYLGTWRCWESMPTDEERASIPFNPVDGID